MIKDSICYVAAHWMLWEKWMAMNQFSISWISNWNDFLLFFPLIIIRCIFVGLWLQWGYLEFDSIPQNTITSNYSFNMGHHHSSFLIRNAKRFSLPFSFNLHWIPYNGLNISRTSWTYVVLLYTSTFYGCDDKLMTMCVMAMLWFNIGYVGVSFGRK